MKNLMWSYYPLITMVCLIAVGLYSPAALAQSPDPPPTSSNIMDYDESHAQSIDQQIMCPVCPAETIDQAQVPIAKQMRLIVRELLANGASEAEILSFFADRYGQSIVGAPPKSGFNLIAWVFPVVAIAGALVASIFVLRSMTSKPVVSATSPGYESDSRLQPFLEKVDSDLGLEERKRNGNLRGGHTGDG